MKYGLILIAGLGLAGCTIPIKQASVTQFPDGTTLRMTGEIQGRPVGDSSFALSEVGGGISCSGITTSSGVGTMTCSDGSTSNFQIPPEKYGTFSGSYVLSQPDGSITASGWGKGADLVLLQNLLDASTQ